MKTYEKPIFAVLSLSGNDRLCGSCTPNQDVKQYVGRNIYKLPTQLMAVIDILDKNRNKVLDEEEIKDTNVFGSAESCEVAVEGYCKFTAANSATISS